MHTYTFCRSLTCLFSVLFMALDAHVKPPYSYILNVQLPTHISSSIGMRAFYKGQPLTLDRWALLPEHKKQLTFSVIITEKIRKNIDPDTGVRYLYRKINKKTGKAAPFKWYDLTLVLSSTSEKEYHWNITELKDKNAPLRIPDHGIIILAPPRLIKGLTDTQTCIPEEATESTDEQLSVIQLPSLVIDKKISQEHYEEALLPALIRSLDLNLDHRAPQKEIQKHHKTLITQTVSP